ncbi:MAG: hypothetical protein QM775_06815 [Pirellulales bacterium]
MRFSLIACGGAAVLFSTLWAALAQAPKPVDLAGADKLYNDGNVKDAFDNYKRGLTDAAYDGTDVYARISNALQCLARLNRVPESDEFLEAVAAAHPQNIEILMAVAGHFQSLRHDGFIVAGKFERGNHRGGGDYADASGRDRVRSLQLFVQALPLAVDAHAGQRGDFFLRFAQAIVGNNGYYDAWKLQALTDLTKLPDYERGYRYYGGEQVGAPVDADGNPVYYTVPESFEKAKSDGERWRWAMSQAAAVNDGLKRSMMRQYADFLTAQFGVQTMAQYGYWFAAHDDKADRPQTFALHTLTDEETIARLATGVKRFKLPDEHNPIKIHKALADGKDGYADGSRMQLAETYENRRQYDAAVEWWRKLEEITSPAMKKVAQQRIQQIVGNWGTFEGHGIAPAGAWRRV